MFFKQTLIDQSIYLKSVPDQYLHIDYEKIKKEALDSFEKKKKINSNEYSPYKNYYQLKDNQNVQWLYELIRDFFSISFEKKKTLILRENYYIVINKNSDINLHNHIDEYELNTSPDMSAIIPINSKENEFIEFEFEGGRKRHMKQRVPLNKGEIVLFNSELKHRFITDRTHENLLLLSFQMQLIG